MSKHTVEVEKNLIIVDTKLLSDYFGRNQNTIRGWKNSKNMPTLKTDDRGVNYFDLLEAIQWVKLNISERFNKNKSSTDIDDTEINLNLPIDISQINLKNSDHLAILAAHPLGEMIRDTIEFVEDLEKKKIESASKKHDLEVKQGKYIELEEMNKAMCETFALLKDSDINARAKMPVEISDMLLAENLIEKDNKSIVQEKIKQAIDEVQNEKYSIIKTQFMKYIKDKTGRITIQLLKEMIEEFEKEKNK